MVIFLRVVSRETVLCGHSLDSDLRVSTTACTEYSTLLYIDVLLPELFFPLTTRTFNHNNNMNDIHAYTRTHTR